MPDLPNPLDALAGSFSASFAEVASSTFDAAMKTLWEFALNLLHGVFDVIDGLTTPDLDPRTGPLAAVLPATAWTGGVLLLLLCLVQVGKAAMSGGTGFLHLFKGLAQYVLVSATALGVLAAVVAAANAAALGILSGGLGVQTWGGISTTNDAWQNTVNGVSGAGLGLLALLGLIPAAFSLLIVTIVREAAILFIAATIPILAAGLVAEATARWFWIAIRWLMALVMLTPAVALVMTIGLKISAGAAGSHAAGAVETAAATTDSPPRSAVAAAIAACILLVAVFCPLALFKLFAFVDPATPSGQQLRTSMSGGSSASPSAGIASTSGADGSGRTSQEASSAEHVESRWTQSMSKLSLPHQMFGSSAQSVMSAASPVLAAAGVGHGLDHDPAAAGDHRSPRTKPQGQRPGDNTSDDTGSQADPMSGTSTQPDGTSQSPATPAGPTPPDIVPLPQPPSPDGSSGSGAGGSTKPAPGGGSSGATAPGAGGAGAGGAGAGGAGGVAAAGAGAAAL